LPDVAICPASDAAMELRARMGVRGSEPNHKCVLQCDEYIWFFRPGIADCCTVPSFDTTPPTTSGPQAHAWAATVLYSFMPVFRLAMPTISATRFTITALLPSSTGSAFSICWFGVDRRREPTLKSLRPGQLRGAGLIDTTTCINAGDSARLRHHMQASE